MNIQIQPGLGDAIYNYPIIKELSNKEFINVETGFPEIFYNLPNAKGFIKINETIDLHLRFHVLNYSAYSQLCTKTHVYPEFDFSDFPTIYKPLETNNKKLCVIKEPCAAGRHKDKNEMREAADFNQMQRWIDENRNEYYFVSVGQNEKFTERLNIDLDLNDKLSTYELLALCRHADLIATQIGHLVAIGCAFRIPLKLFKAIGDSDMLYEKRKLCTIVPNTSKIL